MIVLMCCFFTATNQNLVKRIIGLRVTQEAHKNNYIHRSSWCCTITILSWSKHYVMRQLCPACYRPLYKLTLAHLSEEPGLYSILIYISLKSQGSGDLGHITNDIGVCLRKPGR